MVRLNIHNGRTSAFVGRRCGIFAKQNHFFVLLWNGYMYWQRSGVFGLSFVFILAHEKAIRWLAAENLELPTLAMHNLDFSESCHFKPQPYITSSEMVLYVAKQLKLISILFKYSSFLCHSILITLTLLSNQKWMEESKNVAKFLAFLWEQSHPIIIMMTMGLIEIVLRTWRKNISSINFNFHFKWRAVLSLFMPSSINFCNTLRILYSVGKRMC